MVKNTSGNNKIGIKQPIKENLNREIRDKTANVKVRDKVQGNVTTTSTGPRDPIKNKK